MNICPVEAELFHADRWTDTRMDMTKLIVAFYSVANAPISFIIIPCNSNNYSEIPSLLHNVFILKQLCFE